jgi:hypothetical protein
MPSLGFLTVNSKLQRIFDSAPEDEPRSRLEPYRELILRWRRQGRSYRRICKLLSEKCQLKVSYLALYEFVQRRSRPRKAEQKPERQPAEIAPPEQTLKEQAMTFRPRPRRTPEEIAAMRAAASASNHKPVFQIEPETKPLFVYDPSRPLINKPTPKEK